MGALLGKHVAQDGSIHWVELTCDADGKLLVSGIGGSATVQVESINRGAAVDRSGAVAAGGVAQQAAPANAARRLLLFQNLSSGDLFVRTDGVAAAGAGSIRVQPGQLLSLDSAGVFTGAVSVYGAVSGQVYTCKEF